MAGFWDILAGAGNAMALPGSSVRDLLAGENPFDQWADPFNDTNRTSGRDLLRHYGAAGPEDNWGNFAGGEAVNLVTDPLTWMSGGIGAGLTSKMLGKASKIKVANQASQVRRAAGDMPEEIAKLTKAVNKRTGLPKTVFHGTPSQNITSARDLNLSHAGSRDPGFRGHGIYFTPSESHALEEYAGPHGKSLSAYLDARNPHYADVSDPWGMASEMEMDGRATDLSRRIETMGEIESVDSKAMSREYTAFLKSKGHDSVFDVDADELMVFDPSQIYNARIAPALKKPPRHPYAPLAIGAGLPFGTHAMQAALGLGQRREFEQ